MFCQKSTDKIGLPVIFSSWGVGSANITSQSGIGFAAYCVAQAIQNTNLVGGLEPWDFMTFYILGMENHPNWRTPSFFRGVGIPPTSNKWLLIIQKEGVGNEESKRRGELYCNNSWWFGWHEHKRRIAMESSLSIKFLPAKLPGPWPSSNQNSRRKCSQNHPQESIDPKRELFNQRKTCQTTCYPIFFGPPESRWPRLLNCLHGSKICRQCLGPQTLRSSIVRLGPNSIHWKWVCLKIVYPYTQWFCWSLSLLNGYFIGNINPTFSDKPKWLCLNSWWIPLA